MKFSLEKFRQDLKQHIVQTKHYYGTGKNTSENVYDAGENYDKSWSAGENIYGAGGNYGMSESESIYGTGGKSVLSGSDDAGRNANRNLARWNYGWKCFWWRRIPNCHTRLGWQQWL